MRIVLRASNDTLPRIIGLAEGIRDTDPSSEILLITSGSRAVSIPGIRQADIGTQNTLSWDLEYTENAIPEPVDIIVLDNRPDEKYQKAMKKKARMLVVIDDEPNCRQYFADAIVNPNVHAHTLDYRGAKDTELLLGTEFYPLGSAFDEFQDFAKETEARCRKISVCLGEDRRSAAMDAIRILKKSGAHFLAGVSLPLDEEKGEKLASEIGLDERFIVADPDPRRQSASDLAICSLQTLHEFIFFRVPALLSDPSASPLLSDYCSKAGICFPLCEESLLRLMNDPEERRRVSGRMADLVDGLGRFRLAEELLAIHENF
jgi:spore coat polysaccharide biosynthesis predicted glycosyltransferase SpsG